MTTSVRWVEPFAYKAGEPFRIMPIGEFKRGDRKLSITKERLEQMAANAGSGRPRWAIPLYAGHPTDQNPDPPKIGNAVKLEVRPDGLYAFPEYTPDGEKLVKDGAYQFNSPGVMWDLNGSTYADEHGAKHNNVLDHIALTNRPWFGKATALFSEPGVLEKFEQDTPGLMHRLRTAAGLMKRVMSALDVQADTDPDGDGDDDTQTQIVNAEAEPGAGGQPVPNVPAPAEKGAPVDMTDDGVMKNQLPRAVVAQVESTTALLSATAAGADKFAGLPPMVKCPECGHAMPQGTKCPECGYQDDGKKPAEKMGAGARPDKFRDYNTETRQEMAKSGAAMPDGAYPIANAADLQNAISAVGRGGSSQALIKAHIIKRAKALGLTDRLPADWEGSTKENTMSDQTPNETFAIKPDEFAALKAKADQFDALKQQVDTYAAELVKERRARRIEQFTAQANDYLALPVDARETAEKFAALEDAAPDLLKWVQEKFAAFDKALAEGDLFTAKASARGGNAVESFAALTEQIHRDKFNAAPEKYSEAMALAREQRPDLFAEYQTDYAPNRK